MGTGDPEDGKGREKALEVSSADRANVLRRARHAFSEPLEASASRRLMGQRGALA